MRIKVEVVLAAAAFCVPSACGFQKSLGPYGPRRSQISPLQARYSPPPPPPPPPILDNKNPFTGALESIQHQIDALKNALQSGVDVGHLSSLIGEIREKVLGLVDSTSTVNFLSPLEHLSLPNLDTDQLLTTLGQIEAQLQNSFHLERLESIVDVSPLAEAMSKLNNDVLGSVIRNNAGNEFLLESTNYPLTLGLTTIISTVIVSAVLRIGDEPPPSMPYPRGRYDPATSRAYFDRRLPIVVSRAFSILFNSLRFGLQILKDQRDGVSKEVEYQRGKELAELLTKLGPTFIKVGQSLSIRTDLLSPAYIRGLETLQDKVPSFDTEIAREILQKEWGCSVESVIESLPPEPVAAASLGQVYRAKLRATGQEVAIKVQRPSIREQIALDMYLLREAAPILKSIGNLNSDTVGTVDAWGSGFVDELDYLSEAKNAANFQKFIDESPLKEVVFAPKVVENYSTGTVLVSEWVDGERLDLSNQEDTAALCSIAMNTYLSMLLDFGTLHCDPHRKSDVVCSFLLFGIENWLLTLLYAQLETFYALWMADFASWIGEW